MVWQANDKVKAMSVSGVDGANTMMVEMMRILMQGMQEQMAMSQKMLAVGVEMSLADDQMALAQHIIDVYA